MIDINSKKVKQVIEEIHSCMNRKVKKGGTTSEDIILENQILEVISENFEISPTSCAVALNRRYGYDLTGNMIIEIFRKRKIANQVERKELFCWAEQVTELFAHAIVGDKKCFDEFQKLRKEPAGTMKKRHPMQERIAAVMIYSKYPEIDLYDETKRLESLGTTLAKYFFYDMADAIGNIYGFDTSVQDKGSSDDKKLSLEESARKIEQLEKSLERTNNMLIELQTEFDQQIEESKTKELAEFFTKLNSDKYGCILDELLAVNKGIDILKKSHFEVPIEINGLLIMVKKLIMFVRDNHISPIMKLHSTQRVKAADVEFCIYEGSPFINNEEEKTIRVVSPGWIYKDKDIQIARPKVREVI